MPVLPEEQALREKFETIGVKPAQKFEVQDEATRAALVQGMQARLADDAGGLGESEIVG